MVAQIDFRNLETQRFKCPAIEHMIYAEVQAVSVVGETGTQGERGIYFFKPCLLQTPYSVGQGHIVEVSGDDDIAAYAVGNLSELVDLYRA